MIQNWTKTCDYNFKYISTSLRSDGHIIIAKYQIQKVLREKMKKRKRKKNAHQFAKEREREKLVTFIIKESPYQHNIRTIGRVNSNI